MMNRVIVPRQLGLVVLCALLAAGGAAGAQTAPQESGGESERIVLDRVAAVVNDEIILQSELEARVEPLTLELRNVADERERTRRRSKLTRQMLDDMISEALIVQAAKDAQIRVEAKEVNAAIEEIKKQNNLGDEELEEALAMQGYTMASYKKDVQRQILRMRALNMLVRPRVTITDEDVRALYEEMNRRSSAVSQVHLRHVLIHVPENPSAQQLAAAKERASEVIEQAKGGKSFAELARQYSDDAATSAGGGDLGWIEHGSLPTEWEEVVFSMDKGEVRGPISGPSGLHVFYVEDSKKDAFRPFDEVKEQLRGELYSKEMDKQTSLWLEELRKKAHIDRKR